MKFYKKNLTSPSLMIAFWLLLAVISFIQSSASEAIPSSSISSNSFSSNKQLQRSSGASLLSVKETPSPGGFWKTKREWKAYWVKDWAIKKIYVPVWKRVWGPVDVREWVPTGVAKPRPGIKLD